jgi:hypothetical protein
MNQSTNFVGQHIFSQILSLSSQGNLQSVFNKTKANRYYKKIKAWNHYVSMMFCVLSGCTSLREICMGLEAFEGKLNHIGLSEAPARSTLSDANKNRPSSVFQNIFNHLSGLYRPFLSDSTLPAAVLSRLFLVDSTVFGLFKAILKTSGRHPKDGRKKGGIKKNTMLQATSLMPVLIRFNAAADHDQQFLKFIELPAGSYIVFDKGYNNYLQFSQFAQKGIFFITRQKDNAVYTSVQEKDLTPDVPDEVLKDEIIELIYKDEAEIEQVLTLRRIAWWSNTDSKCYEFITNNFELEAKIIADIYRFRWQIELFFKKLKQNFPLHYFVGDNQNAIEIQIWCALIALLLLTYIHNLNQSKMAFSNLMMLLRIHLAGYISIKTLLRLHNQKRKRGKKDQSTLTELFGSS